MQENTNKAIAYNSLILYITLAITSLCGIFNTRFSLKALGVDDYGLFAVLGSIITMIDVVNTIMISTTTRFMAVAIGRGDINEINKQFNINRNIHIAIAILTLVIAFPIGDWYIHNHINYPGDISNAMMVFSISIVASIITFVGVPYMGLMRAKENFLTPSIVSIISSVSKLIFVYLLIYFFTHKLFLYALFTGILTSYPTLVNIIYCRKHYVGMTNYIKVGGFKEYKEVFGFAAWSGVETLSTVFKSQGAGLIINAFFTTTMNAALGIANTISGLITNFAGNINQPMLPQISKTYSGGDQNRCNELVVMSTKFTYLIILFISAPFLMCSDWILQLWLGNVPEYAVSFMTLLVIDNLVGSFNKGLQTMVYASGKIAVYTLANSISRVIVLVVAYFVLKSGARPESLFVCYILFSIIIVIANQIIIHYQLDFDNMVLVKNSYLPSIIVTILYIPIQLINIPFHPIVTILLTWIYLFLIIYFVGFSKGERVYFYQIVKRVFAKK